MSHPDWPSAADCEPLPPLSALQPLSDADRDKFLAALDNPPPPNAALKRALAAAAELRTTK